MQPRVTYYTIPPPASIAGFVRMFWVYEMAFDDPCYIYRAMASGCPEMVFHYRGLFDEITDTGIVKHGASMVHAQSQHYRRFITKDHFGIFGVYLYPFALPYLFNISATDASNHMPDLHTLLGQAGKNLEEQVILAANNTERVDIVSKFLQQRLQHCKVRSAATIHAIKTLLTAKENIPVSQLAYDVNVSTRQLERNFKAYTGFSPKLFTRITRFQSALNQYGNNTKSLTDVGYECGYYDQSHFIHDFKAFSGYHPAQYFKGRPEGIEYRDA